jgi:hypothetical protein
LIPKKQVITLFNPGACVVPIIGRQPLSMNGNLNRSQWMVGHSPAGRSYPIFDEVSTPLLNEPSGPLHTVIIGGLFTDTDLEWIEFINRRLKDTPEQQERNWERGYTQEAIHWAYKDGEP